MRGDADASKLGGILPYPSRTSCANFLSFPIISTDGYHELASISRIYCPCSGRLPLYFPIYKGASTKEILQRGGASFSQKVDVCTPPQNGWWSLTAMCANRKSRGTPRKNMRQLEIPKNYWRTHVLTAIFGNPLPNVLLGWDKLHYAWVRSDTCYGMSPLRAQE